MRTLATQCAVVAFLATSLVGPAVACTISTATQGTLALSPDGTVLGSEVAGGTSASVFTLLPLLSGVTIDVAAPTVSQVPAGYDSGSQVVEVAYRADVVGLLNVTTQPYTAAATSFSTGVLGAVTLTITMENRIINPAGFAAGTYGTQTVVTCHP